MIKRAYEYNLEGLRALAALMVVYGHVLYYNDHLDPNWKFQLPGNYIPPGHFSVLIFFCLSGYVIGINNKNPLQTKFDILTYLKKRFIRLYPVYLVSLVMIFPFLHLSDLSNFVKHLVFGQNILCPVFYQNNPLWSLNYEVIYYLLFIPISFFKISPKRVLAVLAIIMLANFGASPFIKLPWQFTSYVLGFSFWVSGLMLAGYSNAKRDVEISGTFLLSTFLLILANKFQIFTLPDTYKNFFKADVAFIPVNDLLYLPHCIYFILIMTNIKFPFRKQIIWLVYLLPSILFLKLIFADGQNVLITQPFPLGFYVLSLMLLIVNSKIIEAYAVKIAGQFTYWGSISYGIYVVHFPLLSYFRSSQHFSGSALTYVARLLVFTFLIFALSIFLEKHLQVKVKRYLEKLFALLTPSNQNGKVLDQK